ncbi:MAG: UDP-N-acetylmuramate--L-alanine ligase [Bacteroidales bacterium]|nr:UDP-N-acetylmuramate--L-alanine ligase [Bacteroidales bacterium]
MNVYFIGIGGIGMSAIARYYKRKGNTVSGYDRTRSLLTAELEAEGIPVHYSPDCSLIPSDKGTTLVIWTPAVPQDMEELVYVRENGYRLIKRSRALGEICIGQRCLAVAGTHGKTTTTTLIAHIMNESGPGASAFLGGISKNYGTNLLVSAEKNIVVEADEFDRSFLQLNPTVAVITAMDADHLDIYGDLAHVQDAYRQFASQVGGTLILKYGLPITREEVSAHIYTYHLDNPEADFHGENLQAEADGHYRFDLAYPGGLIQDIRAGIPGWIGVENSIAAAAVCLCEGISHAGIRKSVGNFQGVRRRLDERFAAPGLNYIDDYAHHPAELAAAISSLRKVFPGRKITGVFQPHLYTRTRDFAPEFAAALSSLDSLILLDIYPAREEPIPGVTSALILDAATCPEKVLVRKDELLDYLKDKALDVLVTFGAGDIDRLVEPIAAMLCARRER